MERENATDKLISIIIPVLNAEKYIEATLCNLFAQTYQNFEIIIAYDKRSTDNTLEILKNISTIHPLKIDQDVDANTGSATPLKLSMGRTHLQLSRR